MHIYGVGHAIYGLTRMFGVLCTHARRQVSYVLSYITLGLNKYTDGTTKKLYPEEVLLGKTIFLTKSKSYGNTISLNLIVGKLSR